MSRIGKQLINIPAGLEVKLDKNLISVKGPKGHLTQKIHPLVTVLIDGQIIKLSVKNEKDRSQRALWGLFASLIKNMIKGATEGFVKKLEISGVGFRASVAGNKLILNVGFSHPVEYEILPGVDIKVEKNIIIISGADKQLVGEVAAQIRRIKKPEPYKGSGIKYHEEKIRRKAGKTAAVKTK